MVTPAPQEHSSEELQVISLDNICMVGGSWTSTAQFNGCGWVWNVSFRKIQLMRTRNLRRRETILHSEIEVLRWVMKSILHHLSCKSFETDCKDLIAMIKEPQAWPSFATELEAIKTLQICFPDFKISHIPKAQNGISDSLSKIARFFHRKFCYIACFILVWLPRPPQIGVIE